MNEILKVHSLLVYIEIPDCSAKIAASCFNLCAGTLVCSTTAPKVWMIAFLHGRQFHFSRYFPFLFFQTV